MHEHSSHLDGQYAAFGRVTDGLDVVDAIANTPRNRADKPDAPQRMKTVTVDTQGQTYPEAAKL